VRVHTISETHPKQSHLTLFVRESNKIEGITREPTAEELKVHDEFLKISRVNIMDVCHLVRTLAGAELRLNHGMNVRVGSHTPPPGGPAIGYKLEDLLHRVNEKEISPWHAHVEYETIHPFMDGNGRSGRALWAWQMLNQARNERWMDIGFLHLFYYQTLSNSR